MLHICTAHTAGRPKPRSTSLQLEQRHESSSPNTGWILTQEAWEPLLRRPALPANWNRLLSGTCAFFIRLPYRLRVSAIQNTTPPNWTATARNIR